MTALAAFVPVIASRLYPFNTHSTAQSAGSGQFGFVFLLIIVPMLVALFVAVLHEQRKDILVLLISPRLWFNKARRKAAMETIRSGRAAAADVGYTSPEIGTASGPEIRFSDIGGHEEPKRELGRVLDFLRNPDKYKRLGAKLPRGILLDGPPGNGKTMLAQALAYESGVRFLAASGSEFVEKWVGVGAQRVRKLFADARKGDNAKAIIFIDEIDAVGRRRTGHGGGNEEREQTLNQLLTEMNGFKRDEQIFVLAATNRADILDEALVRPGRFTLHIHIDKPDLKGREAILKVASKDKPLHPSVDLHEVARRTMGLSGAHVAELLNEAALLAVDEDADYIMPHHIFEGIDRVLLGPRSGRVVSETSQRRVAFHEAGHTLLAYLGKQEYAKVTITPRSRALGYLHQPDEQGLKVREDMLAKLRVALAGRASEEMIYGDENVSNGASGDLQQAGQLARLYIEQFGMGSSLYVPDYEAVPSQEHRARIDKECHSLLDTLYQETKELLRQNEASLYALANGLLDKETLEADDITRIIEDSLDSTAIVATTN